MKDRNAFKRMVVGLPPSSRDYTGVATAAKLAELLGLGVLATFVEDATLLDAAGLPCVRELRSLEGGWRPIIVAQLTRELESAAAASRQLFAEATKACGIETSFNLARGSAADVISSLATADDIIAIVAPGNPAERVTQQFTKLIAAAFNSAAAVMIVPSRTARLTGPIVAIAAGPDDPSIAAAVAIAAAAGEQLVLVSLGHVSFDSTLEHQITSAGVRLKVATAMPRVSNTSALAVGVSNLNGRVLVVRRGNLEDPVAVTLASRCAIPVLVIEPPVGL